MTVLVPGNNSYYLGTQAILLNEDRDTASHWASGHIISNPAIRWVLGKYVEANNANYNGQYWRLEDLQMKKPTIVHSPMNMNHQPHKIVGTFPAAEMMYPVGDSADDGPNPYIETLGAFWKFYFPDELSVVESAFNGGNLFQSMECVASPITCVGDGGCGETFSYAGPMSTDYCDHIQGGGAKQLNDPHFLAGALIVPPASPGWGGASVKELSALIKSQADLAEKIYDDVSEEMPHLEAPEWETLMAQLLARANNVEL